MLLAVGVLGVVSAAAVSQPHACTEDGDLHDLDVISHGDWYFNTRLAAPNVWEIDVSPETVDKAAALFNEIDLPLPVITAVPTNTSVKTASGASYFVSQNPFGSVSDLQWISVDDQPTYDAFNKIFKELEIPQRFAHLVSGSINMISATYVVRSHCKQSNVHVDYFDEVGTQAFTLMTPLRNYAVDYNSQFKFQLLYESEHEGEEHARYTYRKGKAIVFASQFKHSTEPGMSSEPGKAPHVYLCFAFGSDDPRLWPAISQTVGGQSRLVSKANGKLEQPQEQQQEQQEQQQQEQQEQQRQEQRQQQRRRQQQRQEQRQTQREQQRRRQQQQQQQRQKQREQQQARKEPQRQVQQQQREEQQQQRQKQQTQQQRQQTLQLRLAAAATAAWAVAAAATSAAATS
jgi:hypothetical protein